MTHADPASTTTILYVEDDPINQELMRSVIRKRPGVRLVTAGLGADALEAAAAERPALILLDRHLPDMTGDEILQLLRARRETEAIPVVIVSGDTAAPRTGEAALGVTGYLTKPYDIRELLSYIDRALDPRRDPGHINVHLTPGDQGDRGMRVEAGRPPAEPVDERWVVVVADDDEMARELVVRYFVKLKLANRVVYACDGDDAVRVLSDEGLRPVLVLLDLKMPGRSGLDVLRWVRGEHRLAEVPVVMLTGSAELDEVEEAYAVGISAYLVKPVGFAALEDVVRRLGLPWALVPTRRDLP
jgi:two-component system, response regulator